MPRPALPWPFATRCSLSAPMGFLRGAPYLLLSHLCLGFSLLAVTAFVVSAPSVAQFREQRGGGGGNED